MSYSEQISPYLDKLITQCIEMVEKGYVQTTLDFGDGGDFVINPSPRTYSEAATTVLPATEGLSEDYRESEEQEDIHVQFTQLEKEIKECTKCRLCQERRQAVPGMGVVNPEVLVVGEGPGEQEDIRGLPFVGPSGEYLDKWLDSIGLSRNTNVYISNTVKCRPPKNRNPYPDEIKSCNAYLLTQVRMLKPRVILALGKVAGNILTNNDNSRIDYLRSKIFEYEHIPLFVTYHPSAVLRNPNALRSLVWEDLKKLRDFLAHK